MGLQVDCCDEHKPNLSLSQLPSKPSQPNQMLMPPRLHQSLSVPFRWEVEPGKARSSTDAAVTCSTPSDIAAARLLDLPPRLMFKDDGKNVGITLPSSVTVPDGPYICRPFASTFSFRKKGVVTAREDGGARKLGSGRWGSFKEEGMFCLGDAFKNGKNIKRSFSNFSDMNFTIWADICASLRHVVPWRRRRE